METIILSSDNNFNIIEYKFKTNIIDNLMNFVLDCKQNIIYLSNCDESEILMCAPKYIIELMKTQHAKLISCDKLEKGDIYFCGVKIQPSYENSITVFYNAHLPTQIIKYTQNL